VLVFSSIFYDIACVATERSTENTDHERHTLALIESGQASRAVTAEWERGFSDTASGTAAQFAAAIAASPVTMQPSMCGMAVTILYQLAKEQGPEAIAHCAELMASRLEGIKPN
jgi:hypothetical protein